MAGPATTGILMMLLAYLLFALADGTTKWIVLAGIPTFQVAFIRYAVNGSISSSEVVTRGFDRAEITGNIGLLSLRALLLVTSTLGNFYALKYLPLSMYSAIMFSAPIFVCLMSWPLLGERVGPWRWFAILLGFVGVVIIVRPLGAGFHWGGLGTLYAAVALAVYSIITRKLAHKVRPHVMQFFSGAFGMVILLPFAFSYWVPAGWTVIVPMLWVGFASWLGHEILTRAHKLAEASVLMPYAYSFIVYMSLAGFLFYDEVPDAYTMTGAAVVVAAGLIIWYRERQAG